MIEQWYKLTLEPGPRPALVLDTSEGARKIWPYLRSLTAGVLEAMPRVQELRLFFLGNPQAYPASEFPAKAEEWHAANAGRARVIGPICERLAEEAGPAVAVVGNGRIFDVDDWRGHGLAERAAWCQVGPGGMTNGTFAEDSYTCEQLAAHLNNPALRVEIGGNGVMPFFWDDPTFCWANGQLVGARTTGTLHVGALALEMDRIRATVVHANGARRELAMAPAAAAPSADWVKIPTGEFNLLRVCLRLGQFQCPACNGAHPAGRYVCPQSNGRPIFPMLATLAPGGFGLLDTAAWNAKIRPHPCPALLLDAEAVALRSVDGVVIFRYDAGADAWRPAERFSFSRELDKDLHAVVL